MLSAVVVVAILQLANDDGPAGGGEGEAAMGDPALDVLDPATGELLSAIPLGTAPANVAVGEGGVWVLDADDRTISRIDPRERALVRTFSTGSTPTTLAAGAGAIWIGNASGHSSYPGSVSRIDPESGVVDATIGLPGSDVGGYFQGGGSDQQLIAVTDDAVWVVNPDQTVSRIDPRSTRVVGRVADIRATSIAAGEGGVWAADTDPVAGELAARRGDRSRDQRRQEAHRGRRREPHDRSPSAPGQCGSPIRSAAASGGSMPTRRISCARSRLSSA